MERKVNESRWYLKGDPEQLKKLRTAVAIDQAHNGGTKIEVMLRWAEVRTCDLSAVQACADSAHGGDLAKALSVLVEKEENEQILLKALEFSRNDDKFYCYNCQEWFDVGDGTEDKATGWVVCPCGCKEVDDGEGHITDLLEEAKKVEGE